MTYKFSIFRTMALLLVGACRAISVAGHGLPIFVAVDPQTNQVVVSSDFDDAAVNDLYFSDLPGLGVLSPFLGVDVGATIRLRVTQPLLYTNNDQLAPPPNEVTIVSPFPGQAEVLVSATSNQQGPIDWAIYPADAPVGWEAEGLYLLGPGTPAGGVYGVAFQVLVEGAIDSEPFLLPVTYNPADVNMSKNALREALLMPLAADFTRNWIVDGRDLAQWEAYFGTSTTSGMATVLGDADTNGLIDGADFLEWQRQFNNSSPMLLAASRGARRWLVPEPSSLLLMLLVGWLVCSARCCLLRRNFSVFVTPWFFYERRSRS